MNAYRILHDPDGIARLLREADIEEYDRKLTQRRQRPERGGPR